jgi:hypothetical protein
VKRSSGAVSPAIAPLSIMSSKALAASAIRIVRVIAS